MHRVLSDYINQICNATNIHTQENTEHSIINNAFFPQKEKKAFER